MPKSQRQPTESTSKPATEGPTAGAKPMISPMAPMAVPRFSRGKTSRMTVKTMGMTMPVHAACNTRPSSSTQKLGATRRGETTYREDDEPRVEELACREAPDEKGRERDNDRLDERIAAREPLHGGGIDLEARHDGGKRGGEQRLVEHRQQRARQQHAYHHHVSSAHTQCHAHQPFVTIRLNWIDFIYTS